MREFQQKKKRKGRMTRWIFSPLGVVILMVMAAALGRAVWTLYGKEQDTAKKVAIEQSHADALAASQASLSDKVAHLETPEGMDEAIRSIYNVTKPGENSVIFEGSTTATTSE